MFIEQPSKWMKWLYPKALWRMDAAEHSVYLTFDDGPIPESTPFILDTLKEHGVKATFFVVGENVKRYPDLFRRIISEGHSIGNHTYNHMGSLRHYVKTYLSNIETADAVMQTAANVGGSENSSLFTRHSSLEKPLFRPPHGWMWLSAYHMLMKRGYTIVMWDLVTRDYSRNLNAFDVFRNVVYYTRNGSIITFHDSLKSIQKLKYALPASIRFLKEQGYELKTL
ncbi:MAG: polysaccharide deacetylase family protein [Prevotella sp.]|nr:polysaccharide deacetylase family protein [Prevotella sp.]